MFTAIERPPSATSEEPVAELFGRRLADATRVTGYDTSLERWVRIGAHPQPCLARMIETNIGREIVLLRHQCAEGGWWNRVFSEPYR